MPLPLILLALACGDGGGDTAGSPLDPAIELGTGTQFFEPLTDGGTVLIVRGPQGGYHFDGSMQVQGIDPGNVDDLGDPSNPKTTFTVTDAGNQVAYVEYVQGIRTVAGEKWIYEMIGRRVFLDIVDDAELDGHEVVMTVEVTDSTGLVLSDSKTLMAEPHPLNN